jgi:hypothetical protein
MEKKYFEKIVKESKTINEPHRRRLCPLQVTRSATF